MESSNETSPDRAGELVKRVVDSTSGALLLLESLDRGEIPSSLKNEVIEHAAASSGLNTRGLFTRFLPPSQRREELGSTIEPAAIMGHSSWLLAGAGAYEMASEKMTRLPLRLKTLVDVKAAMMIGCPF